MLKRKIRKYYEYGVTKIKILYKEKTHIQEGHKVKYILEKYEGSEDLVVVFSGLPRPGIKARYNNGRTLKDVKANRLFILDDLGYDQRGGYYLGKNKDFYLERGVISLINKVKSELNINKTIYCGSSKGGWAALYFGIRDDNSSIIIGTLQYYMGSFVTRNDRIKNNLMKYVMGDNYTEDDVNFLNNLLKETVEKHKNNKCDIHIHYSDSEYTYRDYMVYLLRDLDELGIKYTEDVQHYSKHEELSLYYPPFLLSKVNELLNNK